MDKLRFSPQKIAARDHYVKLRDEPEISEYARRVRSYMGADEVQQIDIRRVVDFIKGKAFPNKGPLQVDIYSGEEGDPSAYVTFDPLTLHLEREIWDYAGVGDPWSRFIIAHEIGHVVLHDRFAKAFTGEESAFTLYDVEQRSAEWQANVFAWFLLAPDQMAIQCKDASELALKAGIETMRAQARLDSLNRRKLWRPATQRFFGESCRNCGNFTLTRINIKLKCETCNRVVDIFSNGNA